MPKGDKFFVRSADNSLYVVSKNKVDKLSDADKAAVEKILEETEVFLEAKLKDKVSSLGSMVNVPLPNIFPT